MIKFRFPTLLLGCLFLWIISGSSCRKAIIDAPDKQGAIALTFDDDTIDNWFEYVPLLDSLHIKATFYISNFHKLSLSQRDKLHQLAAGGHEIGYHTTHHYNLAKLKEQKGLAYVIATEIDPDREAMRKEGFLTVSFAYPYGCHTEDLDIALGRKFHSLRAVSNKDNWDKSLTSKNKDLLYGADIDEDGRLSDDTLLSLLEKARENHDCVILTAHKLLDGPLKRHLSRKRLLLLASEAKKRNLPFVTIQKIFP